MAERDDIEHDIVIGSVQSCCRPKRLERIRQQNFGLLLIDEAHHATTDSYLNIIDAIGFDDATKLLLGVTATPNRSDNQKLGDVFDKVTFSRSIATMIKANYLSPAVGRRILTNFSLQNVGTRNGEFILEDLAEAVNTAERNAFIARKYKEHASERKGVAFCADVQHCQDLAEAFRQEGIAAEAIWGDMAAEERKSIVSRLKEGTTQVAMSCGVLCEGFDEPSISCIAMARPTKSQPLYIQCVGRGLRTCPGKSNCLVLDFTDSGHNLDSMMSLGKTIPEAIELREKPASIEEQDIDRSPKIEIINECDTEFDLLGTARFIWIPIGDNEWSLIDDDRNEIIIQSKENGFIADIFTNRDKKGIVTHPIPLEYCSGICEDYARKNLNVSFANSQAPWLNQHSAPSKTQVDFLQKNKAFRDGMSKGEASMEIRKITALKNKQRRQLSSEPITPKQQYLLQQYGIDTANMSKQQAMREIAKIKRAG
jgi:hypothetical protein